MTSCSFLSRVAVRRYRATYKILAALCFVNPGVATRLESGAFYCEVARSGFNGYNEVRRGVAQLVARHVRDTECCIMVSIVGEWRSLVARYVRDVEAPGSNPGSPTNCLAH